MAKVDKHIDKHILKTIYSMSDVTDILLNMSKGELIKLLLEQYHSISLEVLEDLSNKFSNTKQIRKKGMR